MVAKMEDALQTLFGTSLLSTTAEDQESDRLATIGVIISFYSFISESCFCSNLAILLINMIYFAGTLSLEAAHSSS